MHRLLRRTALSINRCTRHHIAKPGCQPAGASNVARQGSDGIETTEDHILVFIIRNVVSLNQRFQDKTAEIGAVHRGKRTTSLSGRCSNCIDNIRFCALSHTLSPFNWLS
jgi:hypothetical protein